MKPYNLTYQTFIVGDLAVNAYILYLKNENECLIIDPGDDPQRLTGYMEKEGLTPAAILLTHGHIDHCGGVKRLKEMYDIPLIIHRDTEPMLHSVLNKGFAMGLNVPLPPGPDRLLRDGEKITLAGMELEIIHTPGHSPGSICLKTGGLMFTGDTLFQGGVGRTDLDGGDFNRLRQSLERLRGFPPETVILPGHGDESTLAREIQLNPYL